MNLGELVRLLSHPETQQIAGAGARLLNHLGEVGGSIVIEASTGASIFHATAKFPNGEIFLGQGDTVLAAMVMLCKHFAAVEDARKHG